MPIEGPGQEQLRELAAAFKEAGEEGKGLRQELLRQLDAAVQPLARKIADAERLKPYMPDRYAAVLAADLNVSTQKLLAGNSPRISIIAKGRAHKRKVQLTEDGTINHPIFAQGLRRTWNWENGQVKGMRPGWFSDPCEQAIPDIREHVMQALEDTAGKIAP